MMNLPAEWRDRNGTLYVAGRRTAAGTEYRLAGAHQQPRSTDRNLGGSARGADDVNLLADKARALSLGKKPTPAATLSRERYAPTRDQLDRFQAALAAAR